MLDSQVWPCFDQPPLVTPQAAQPAEAIVGADGTRTWLGLAVSKVQAAVRFMSEGSKPSLALAASEDGSLRSASDRCGESKPDATAQSAAASSDAMPAAGVSNQQARLLSLVEAEVGADAARKGLSDPPPRAPRAETGGMFPQLAPSAPCEVWHHTLRADSRSAACLATEVRRGCLIRRCGRASTSLRRAG